MRSLVLILLLALLSVPSTKGNDRQAILVARTHVETSAVYRGSKPDFGKFESRINRLLDGRDAETKTMSFVHAIRRQSGKLLTPNQADRLNALLENRQSVIKRLHDERNVLRGFFFAKAWEMPLLEKADRQAAMNELHNWLAVWLEITLHERIAHHHLCRDAFALLTPQQRDDLVRGDWDQYVRKSIGHKRAYFGDRVVIRALGKPDRSVQFGKLSDALADEHVAVQRDLLSAERRWRILTLASPSVSDELLAAEWNRTASALGAFFMNQAGHIVRLTRAGYDLDDADIRSRIAAQSDLAKEALEESVRVKLVAGARLHADLTFASASSHGPLQCEGDYRHHLQGVGIGGKGNIFWSFTTTLVKTDAGGSRLKQIEVPSHHGDLCVTSNRVYVAVNLGPFNHPEGKADSWVYVYDLELNILGKHQTPQVIYGAGGMDHRDGRFYVIGGLPASHDKNYVYEYDGKFAFVKRHDIPSGQTHLGIQTAAFIGNQWWFGCYGTPRVMLKTDAEFNLLGKYEFDCAYGIAARPDGGMLVATGPCQGGRCEGALHHVVPNAKSGLRMLKGNR